MKGVAKQAVSESPPGWVLTGFTAHGWEGLSLPEDPIPTGRRFILFGPNSSGKSSFVRLLALVSYLSGDAPWLAPVEFEERIQAKSQNEITAAPSSTDPPPPDPAGLSGAESSRLSTHKKDRWRQNFTSMEYPGSLICSPADDNDARDPLGRRERARICESPGVSRPLGEVSRLTTFSEKQFTVTLEFRNRYLGVSQLIYTFDNDDFCNSLSYAQGDVPFRNTKLLIRSQGNCFSADLSFQFLSPIERDFDRPEQVRVEAFEEDVGMNLIMVCMKHKITIEDPGFLTADDGSASEAGRIKAHLFNFALPGLDNAILSNPDPDTRKDTLDDIEVELSREFEGYYIAKHDKSVCASVHYCPGAYPADDCLVFFYAKAAPEPGEPRDWELPVAIEWRTIAPLLRRVCGLLPPVPEEAWTIRRGIPSGGYGDAELRLEALESEAAEWLSNLRDYDPEFGERRKSGIRYSSGFHPSDRIHIYGYEPYLIKDTRGRSGKFFLRFLDHLRSTEVLNRESDWIRVPVEVPVTSVGRGIVWILGLLALAYHRDVRVFEHIEHYLHPKAAADLAEEIFAASPFTVLETHAESILLRTQSLVAKGVMRHSDPVVLCFERRADTAGRSPSVEEQAGWHYWTTLPPPGTWRTWNEVKYFPIDREGELAMAFPNGFAEIFFRERWSEEASTEDDDSDT